MSTLVVENYGAVRVLTLNRPEKKNAFTEALAVELVGALDDATEDDAVHAVVVTGSGDVFSAGADVHVFLEFGRTGQRAPVLDTIHEPIRAFPKPLIAAVQGLAVGMGVTLLPHFDMVYATESARFVVPFASLGLVVEYGSSFTLPRLIGRQRASEMVLRGKPITALEAAEWGLVTRVFTDETFRDAVLASAQEVAALPPNAVQASKKLLQEGEQGGLADALARESAVLSDCYGSEENVKAVEAFLSRSATRRST